MRSILLFLFFTITVAALSQTKTYIGIKTGGQLSSAFLDHTIFNFRAKMALNSGVHAGFAIKHFSKKRDVFVNTGIQGGINYIQRGWTQSLKNVGLPNYTVTMNYLEIPIEGVGYFGSSNKYFITAGFLIEFLLDSSADPTPSDISTFDFVTYVEGRDRKFGYGTRLSGGMFRDFSFGSLQLEGFFTYSFSNFIDAGDLTNDQLPDISNLWNLGISVGYFIPFGRQDMTK